MAIGAIVLFNIAHDLAVATQQPLFTEMFGAEFRYSGAGVGYQFASAIAGGFTPFIAAALVALTDGSWHLVAIYVGVGCLISPPCSHGDSTRTTTTMHPPPNAFRPTSKTSGAFIIHPAATLRELLAGDEIVAAPGAPDSVTARLVQSAGFPAVYMTGFGATASRLGTPDIGLLTQTEMTEHARNMTRAVDIPVIADADTGYGGPSNIERAVREFVQAGVAAIHLAGVYNWLTEP